MDLGLKDRTVLVTGSSSGVGRAAAVAFGAEGARVGVTYHQNQAGAEETAQRVRGAGGQALVARYDLADPDTIRAAVERIGREWGGLDVLVNNAAPMERMTPGGQSIADLPLEGWQSFLRSSLEGVVLTVQCALPWMRKGEWGRIVNVSSDAAERSAWPGLGPYITAKSGLHGLTRSLAVELGQFGILSNVVVLAHVQTERNQQQVPPEQQEQIRRQLTTRRLITPEDVAAVIVFLGSPVNRQINGDIIHITGGR